MEPITLLLSASLAQGLFQVGKLLVEKGLEKSVAEPLAEPVRQWVAARVNKPLIVQSQYSLSYM